MKASELRQKDEAQLISDLLQLKKEQFNLRFQKVYGNLQKPSIVRGIRKDIARIKTILRERGSDA